MFTLNFIRDRLKIGPVGNLFKAFSKVPLIINEYLSPLRNNCLRAVLIDLFGMKPWLESSKVGSQMLLNIISKAFCTIFYLGLLFPNVIILPLVLVISRILTLLKI